jgi:hypothetical protein
MIRASSTGVHRLPLRRVFSSEIADRREPSRLSEDAAKPCGSAPPQELALPNRLGAPSSAHVYLFAFPDSADCLFVGRGGSSRRMNERPRFSSAVRSVLSVATCTGLPDSCPSQRFNSLEEVETNWPSRCRGIPSAAHRLTTDTGSPKKSEICFQPFRGSSCG